MKRFLLTASLFAALASSAEAQVLSVCIEGSPEIFNPELTSSGTTSYVLNQIYDGLVSVKSGSSEIEPALAESWTVSDDGKTYTFKLRQGVKWQSVGDFTPTRDFNADDVAFTFDRMMKKDHPYAKVGGGNYITFNTKLADELESVEKIDDHTVAFTLKRPLAPFIGIMAHQSLAITSAEYADMLTKAGTPERLDLDPVGTGPFMLQAYQPDAAVRLVPFAQTWGAAIKDPTRTPLVDGVVMAISKDASVRLQRAMAGECQIALFPNLADADRIRESETLDLVQTPVASTGFITFNFRDERFRDKRVREALAEAIDLPSLVDVVYNGMGHVTGSIVPPALWGFDPDLGAHPHDPAKAKALLAQAGFPQGVEFTLAVSNALPDMVDAAVLIQSYAKDAGFTIQIQQDTAAAFAQARSAAAYQALLYRNRAQVQSPTYSSTLFWRPGGNTSNPSRWEDPAFYAAVDAANAVPDPLSEEAGALWEKATAIQLLGAAEVFVCTVQPAQVYRSTVTGYAYRTENAVDFSVVQVQA